MQGFSASAFAVSAFSTAAFALDAAIVVATPAQPSPGPGITVRGKRRALRVDPYLEQLQKQFEEDAQELQAPGAAIAAIGTQLPVKRSRARRENEFFSLLH